MGRGEKREKLINLPKNGFEGPPSNIIIEMDGGLIDSTSRLYQIYTEFLQQHNHEGSKSEFKELLGLCPSEVIAALTDKYGLRKSKEVLLEEYLLLLSKIYQEDDIPFFPKALSALEFANQQGLSIALVSNVGSLNTHNFLRAKKVYDKFEAIITLEELETNPLSFNNSYGNALTLLGIAAEETISIVYSLHSLQDSLEAGIFTFLLTHHHQDPAVNPINKQYTKIRDWESMQEVLSNLYN
jgi:beta-phosphoglucomutase-like phosphatase (HAD superfamily)